MTLLDLSNQFQAWYINDAIPLWIDQAYDQDHGGFYEALNFDGQPITGQPKRVRVQSRQIYTFSQIHSLGWNEKAGAIAKKGFEDFLAMACSDEGTRGCAHTLHHDGRISDDRRDLYDQAFLLLACSSMWATFKDERAVKLAEATLAFLDRELAIYKEGWAESDHHEMPRRQNPHMHMFEASMALNHGAPDNRFAAYPQKLFNLFHLFYDNHENVIREYFDEMLIADETKPVEPGHMVEWVWLLKKYEHFTDAKTNHFRDHLFQKAQEIGADKDFHGLLADSVMLGTDKFTSTKRLWPQTEYLKASLILAEEGNQSAMQTAENIIKSLFTTYLDTSVNGLWVDRYSATGVANAPNVPASILYHLHEAAVQCSLYTKAMEKES